MPFVVWPCEWPCDEKRRHERCKASNNNEGGREETSRKAQTEVDGQSAERFETTPAGYIEMSPLLLNVNKMTLGGRTV